MHQLGFVLFTYLAVVVHVGLGTPTWAGVGIGPHYLLLAMITAVLYFDHWSALIWAAVAGLLSDGVSSGPLGVDMACFTAAAYAMQRHLRRHPEAGTIRLTVLSFVIGVLILSLSSTLRLLMTSRPFDHAHLVTLIITTAGATAFVVCGFRLARALGRKLLFRGNLRTVSY